jgi:hypothetical protein
VALHRCFAALYRCFEALHRRCAALHRSNSPPTRKTCAFSPPESNKPGSNVAIAAAAPITGAKEALSMPILPRTARPLIDWVELRTDLWKADPASIGLDGSEVTELIGLLAAAAAAEEAADLARAEAQAATLRLHTEAESLRAQAASMVATIKAFAETEDDPDVYAAAHLPPDRPKSPLGPPAAPQITSAVLHPDGTVRLKWRGSRKGGTFFQVYRTLTALDGTVGSPTLLASTTDKFWTDQDLPSGLRGVQYYLIARRTGGVSGRSGLGTLQFGSDGAFAGEAAMAVNSATSTLAA